MAVTKAEIASILSLDFFLSGLIFSLASLSITKLLLHYLKIGFALWFIVCFNTLI